MLLQIADSAHSLWDAYGSSFNIKLFGFALTPCLLLLLWRLYTFTLLPLLRPSEPRELPYWVPILGHGISFIKDAQILIARGRKYFQHGAEAFAITVGGRKLYVVMAPDDVSAVYRNNTSLSWDAMLDELLVAFGIKAEQIPKLWAKPEDPVDKAMLQKNPDIAPGQSACHFTLHLYKKQLLPGDRFNAINETLLDKIDRSMRYEDVETRYGSSSKSISLADFCGEVLVDAITRTLFGERIYEFEPNLVRHLLSFNEDAWMLIFQVPQSTQSRLNVARSHILKGLKAYIQAPQNPDDGRTWLIDTALSRYKYLDVEDGDRAGLLLMIYWAANINPYKLAFWMLSYILFDPSLDCALRQETSHAYQDGKLDLHYLMEFCPLLDAVYNETMRITNGALSARKIVAPTPMGNKVLREGNTLLIPFRQLHYNPDVFGNDPGKFEPARFLKDKNLKNNSSFKPFGGGVNYCPGRFLAKQEMLTFVALALNRFDLRLAKETTQGVPLNQPQAFPALDISTPALGVNGPVKGSDVFVDLSCKVKD